MPDDYPDPFAILAQQPMQMPQIDAGSAAEPILSPQPIKSSGLPGVAGLISNLIHPPTQIQVNPQTKMAETTRPVSRLEVFENFLGNFLNSFSQGMAGGGTGPGANARGFGIAVQAPRQLAIQNQQLQNQQNLTEAQANEANQRGQYYASQAGAKAPMSYEMASGMGHPEWTGAPIDEVLKNLVKTQVANQGKLDVTNLANKGKVEAAQVAADARVKAAQIRGPNEMMLRVKAQQGDPDAKQILDQLQSERMSLARTRSEARLYQIQKFFNPETQQVQFGTGYDVLALQKAGVNIVPAGQLSSKDIQSFQQLKYEAEPAIAGVRKNIKAFDNAGDRAIFARILKSSGSPRYGEEAGWMGNIINQAMKENLSPEGQGAAQSLMRLAETMGRLRSTLGGPSTDTQMGLAMQLLPGGSTPNAKYAGQQLDQLEQMVDKAVNIPAYGGNANKPSTSKTGRRVINLVP